MIHYLQAKNGHRSVGRLHRRTGKHRCASFRVAGAEGGPAACIPFHVISPALYSLASRSRGEKGNAAYRTAANNPVGIEKII